MAERKENSVLFSLNELRSIEEERQQEAVNSKRRAEEERVRQQMEAERRAREEAEARRRAAEDAERSARESAERQQREERLRLEEAERRARVEAQAQLEQQRLSQEMQIRAMEAQKKRPTGLIALAAILVVAVVGLGVFLYQRGEESDRRAQALAEYQAEVEQRAQEMRRLNEEQTKLIDELKKAGDDAIARKRAEEALALKQKEIARKEAQINQLKASGKASGKAGGKSSDAEKGERVKPVNCDPNDPLCGM